MFERFTRSAREAVTAAQEIARDLNAEQIGPEHVLLGAVWHADGVAREVVDAVGLDFRSAMQRVESGLSDRDAEALRSLGIDLDQVRSRVEESFGKGALGRSGRRRRPRGHIPFTRGAKKSLELALRDAIRLGHRHIGTEHLLLGTTRAPADPVTDLLADAGTSAQQVHDQLEAKLRAAA